MTAPSPEMRDFAVRLVAYEAAKTDLRTDLPVALGICEKLRSPLSLLMGSTGFSALLSRAHTLALREAPELRAVQVQADGALTGGNAGKLDEGSVALLAQLLGLLEGFVGGFQTMRILREVWPKLTLSDLYFRNDPQP